MNYFEINNRRYMGSKFKLLDFIREVIDNNCTDIKVVADIFAGTGIVSSIFNQEEIIVNDLLYCNYICNYAWFSSEEFDESKLENIINKYNNISILEENYMTKNFTNTYFSYEVCAKVGMIREDIEEKYNYKVINQREYAALITSLIYAMDKIANTVGHYDSYRKDKLLPKNIELKMLKLKKDNNPNNKIYNKDANCLSKEIYADLVYLDPPYNSRQYSDTYHLLENVAKWQQPKVYGIAKKMDRSKLKSKYSLKNATEEFEELIKNLNCRYILFSYNNTAKKANSRSNAKISDQDIIRILSNKGELKIFTKDHKAFSTGKTKLNNNQERLFLCKVKK